VNNQNFINEIKNYYNTDQALSELGDMLQSHRLYTKKDEFINLIRILSDRDEDSFAIIKTGKFLSNIIDQLKFKYEIKD
jgi:hypothetical protein